jgi:hypothetical protein
MEKLEKELDAIKQAVLPSAQHEPRPPPSPEIGSHATNSHSSTALGPAPLSYTTPLVAVVGVRGMTSDSGVLSARAQRPSKASPSQPRTIDSVVVSGEDIDWYFDT